MGFLRQTGTPFLLLLLLGSHSMNFAYKVRFFPRVAALVPLAALTVVTTLATTGCGGKEYVRGSQEPGIDSAAMSTGIDKDDIQRMLSENLNNLRAAPIMNEWRTRGTRATVSIFPYQNTTSEHIDSQLD